MFKYKKILLVSILLILVFANTSSAAVVSIDESIYTKSYFQINHSEDGLRESRGICVPGTNAWSQSISNPFPTISSVKISGSVDDDLTINGSVVEGDKYRTAGDKKCNASHSVDYGGTTDNPLTVGPSSPISIGSVDNYGYSSGINVAVTVEALGSIDGVCGDRSIDPGPPGSSGCIQGVSACFDSSSVAEKKEKSGILASIFSAFKSFFALNFPASSPGQLGVPMTPTSGRTPVCPEYYCAGLKGGNDSPLCSPIGEKAKCGTNGGCEKGTPTAKNSDGSWTCYSRSGSINCQDFDEVGTCGSKINTCTEGVSPTSQRTGQQNGVSIAYWDCGENACSVKIPQDGMCSSVKYECVAGYPENKSTEERVSSSGITENYYSWDCNTHDPESLIPHCTLKQTEVVGKCPENPTDVSCLVGDVTEVNDYDTRVEWKCKGSQNTIPERCSMIKNVDGVCLLSEKYKCLVGNSVDQGQTATHFTWTCTGSGMQGKNTPCEKPFPVRAECADTEPEGCKVGNFIDLPDYETQRNWKCEGLYEGVPAFCVEKIENGVCDNSTMSGCKSGRLKSGSCTSNVIKVSDNKFIKWTASIYNAVAALLGFGNSTGSSDTRISCTWFCEGLGGGVSSPQCEYVQSSESIGDPTITSPDGIKSTVQWSTKAEDVHIPDGFPQ